MYDKIHYKLKKKKKKRKKKKENYGDGQQERTSSFQNARSSRYLTKLFKKENLGKSKGRKESNTILKYTKYLKTHFS